MMRAAVTPPAADARPACVLKFRAAGWLVAVLALAAAVSFGGLRPAAAQFTQQGSQQSAFGPAKPLIAAPEKFDRTKPMLVQADELIYDNQRTRITARGNVEIYYNNYTILADQVLYDQGNNTLEAQGNVRIKEPNGAVINAERFLLTDDFRDGFIDTLRIVTSEDARIAASKATRVDGDTVIFENGFFTPCRPCKTDPSKAPLWQVKAGKITQKQAEGTIYYENAQIQFFGVPVAYLPYFFTPDPSAKRKTGFLAPEYSTSSNLGTRVEIPFYWAIDPSYDLTFHPQYTSKQGVLWLLDGRQKLAFGQVRGEYEVGLAGIDQKVSTLPSASTIREDGWRGSLTTKGNFSLASWWSFGWNATVESDDTFRRFYQLDNAIVTDRVSDVHLVGQSERNYLGIYGYRFGGLLTTGTNKNEFGFATDTSNTSSNVLPIVDYNYIAKNPFLGGELRFDANAMALSRDNGTGSNRIIAETKWRRQLIDGIGQVYTPFASVRGDIYQLSDVKADNPTLDEKASVARGMVTAGLTYQYPLITRTAGGSHIVEPTAQIIARPDRVEQKGIPNEDAKSLFFNENLLFEVDKNSGFDRIETGVRSNLGLQYTFQANSGGFTRVIVGESFHLSNNDNNPYAVGTGLNRTRSDYVTGLYFEPSAAFRFLGQSRFDSETLNLQRTDLFSYINYGPLAATLNYAFSEKTLLANNTYLNNTFVSPQELLATASLRVAEHWYLLGQIRYDLQKNRAIQDSVGIKYLDECFMLSTTYTETFIQDRDLQPDKTVMVRFELKHLGGFGIRSGGGTTASVPIVQNVTEQPPSRQN